MTFARRLVAGTIVVLLVTVLVLVVTAERSLRADLDALRPSLVRQRLLRERCPAIRRNGRFAERFGAAGAVRVSLVDREGRVRADTTSRRPSSRRRESGAARGGRARGNVGEARAELDVGAQMYVACPADRGYPGGNALDQVDRWCTLQRRWWRAGGRLVLGCHWRGGRRVRSPPVTETRWRPHHRGRGTPRFPRSGFQNGRDVAALRACTRLEARFDALRRSRRNRRAGDHDCRRRHLVRRAGGCSRQSRGAAVWLRRRATLPGSRCGSTRRRRGSVAPPFGAETSRPRVLLAEAPAISASRCPRGRCASATT